MRAGVGNGRRTEDPGGPPELLRWFRWTGPNWRRGGSRGSERPGAPPLDRGPDARRGVGGTGQHGIRDPQGRTGLGTVAETRPEDGRAFSNGVGGPHTEDVEVRKGATGGSRKMSCMP